MAGPSTRVRRLVAERADWRCEVCARPITGDHSVHHRLPRGMGGSRHAVINSPANLLLLCGSGTTGCHGWIESHRETAYALGLLVHRGHSPAEVPVHTIHGRVLLRQDGTTAEASEEVSL
jgi:5-methylcytosine-specific restriction protein A